MSPFTLPAHDIVSSEVRARAPVPVAVASSKPENKAIVVAFRRGAVVIRMIINRVLIEVEW